MAVRPSIWAGSWLDYNSGVLHGAWIDAAREDAEIWQDIQAMLDASPAAKQYGESAEDWGVFDYEGFGAIRIGESEPVEWIGTVGRGIAEHGLAFAAYAELVDDTDALSTFADNYAGHFDSVDAYAQQLVDDLGENDQLDQVLSPAIRPYVRVDRAALARDMQASGEIHAVPADGGGVWIFRSNG